jgi:hypothetical protein
MVGAERLVRCGNLSRQLAPKDHRCSIMRQPVLVRSWTSAASQMELMRGSESSAAVASRSFRLPRANDSSTSVMGVECRRFLSTPPPPETDFSKLRRLEDANPERIHGIQVNPESIGSTVLPGNLVYKFYKWTGNTRKVPLELAHGYFWMVKDLKTTDGKPTLPNESIIPEEDAQTFPMLTGLNSLSKETTDLPYFFIADKGEGSPGGN